MDTLSQDYDLLFKILLIGNSSVGKSSILLRFSDDTFQDTFLPTIGVDFKIRTFDQGDNTIKMQIWDTAGQERFKTITASYFKGANGVILVFDITEKNTFTEIESWLAEVEKNSTDKNIVKLLVGNKIDLEHARQVTTDEAVEFAKDHGMTYIETSAKNAINIEKAFTTIAAEIKNRLVKDGYVIEKRDNFKLRDSKAIDFGDGEKPKKKCC